MKKFKVVLKTSDTIEVSAAVMKMIDGVIFLLDIAGGTVAAFPAEQLRYIVTI